MPRLATKDFPQELLDYRGHYAHGKITKCEPLNLVAKYVAGGMTTLALFNLLKPNYALATQVEFTDPDILMEYITYPSPEEHGDVRGYLVKPAKVTGKVPAAMAVHENHGLDPYIEDVARRAARAGFMALMPDGLNSVGGYPGNDDKGRELQQQVDPVKLMNDFFTATGFMQHYSGTTGKVGITGFCYNGGVSNAAVVAFPELACAVPFYGWQVPTSDVPKINASLLLHYVQLNTRINKGWPAYEAVLKANKKAYEAHIYLGVNHGLHNDSTPRYDKAAADLVWERTLTWLNKYSRQRTIDYLMLITNYLNNNVT